MNTEDELLRSRFTRLSLLVENEFEKTKIVYPITSVTLVAESGHCRRFCQTYHKVELGPQTLVARSVRELALILREHFSDSPVQYQLLVERDEKAATAHEVRLHQIASAFARADASRSRRRSI